MTKKEWDKLNTTDVRVKLNNRTDKDLLDYLAKQPSKQGAIKAALRRVVYDDPDVLKAAIKRAIQEDKEKAPN